MMLLLPLLVATALVAGVHQLPPSAPQPVVAASGQLQAVEKLPEQTSPKPVVTRHTITATGRELTYTAAAGELPVTGDSGETEAHIFFIAYTAETSTPASQRPLLFIFNGGPGASSVWLHLGAAGPRRVQMLPDGSLPPSPYRLVDNGSTWLDQA